MTDIPREERTSIIPIPCHWSMGNATSRYTLSLVDGKCYLSYKDGQLYQHKLELYVKLYALFLSLYRGNG